MCVGALYYTLIFQRYGNCEKIVTDGDLIGVQVEALMEQRRNSIKFAEIISFNNACRIHIFFD